MNLTDKYTQLWYKYCLVKKYLSQDEMVQEVLQHLNVEQSLRSVCKTGATEVTVKNIVATTPW